MLSKRGKGRKGKIDVVRSNKCAINNNTNIHELL